MTLNSNIVTTGTTSFAELTSTVNGNSQYVIVNQHIKRSKKPKLYYLIDDSSVQIDLNNNGFFQNRFYKDQKDYWYKLTIELSSDISKSKITLLGSYDRLSWLELKDGHPSRDFGINYTGTQFINKKLFNDIIKHYDNFLKKLIQPPE